MGLALRYEKFDPEAGWLQRFKDHHNAGCNSIHGESREADITSTSDWIDDNMTNIFNGYVLSDTYNAGGSEQLCKTLLSKWIKISREKFEGRKASTQCITVLLSVYMDSSDKQKSLSIEKL